MKLFLDNLYIRSAFFSTCLAAIIMFTFGCSSSPKSVPEVPPDPSWITLDEAIQETVAQVEARLDQGIRVALVNFDSPSAGMSNYTMEEITGALVNAGMTVTDRNNLAYVYKELNFQLSGMVSDETAQAVGKFLGAQSVSTGQLIDAGNFYRFRVNSINVESAVREVSVMLNVYKSRQFTDMLAALETNKLVSKSADYSLTVNPTTAGAFFDRGITFAMRGDFTTAIEAFTEAISLDPSYMVAYVQRAKALIASVLNISSIEDNFESFSTRSYIGQYVPEVNKVVFDKAISDLTQALKLDPNSTLAYRWRGVAYSEKEDYDHAIADHTQAIKLDPNFAKAYNRRGGAYREKKDYDRAIADCTQAIKLDPNYSSAYINRGLAYANKKDYDRAITDFTQAIKLDPNWAAAYGFRGATYAMKGDYDRAITDFTQAIKLDPNDAAAYGFRSATYVMKGDYDRAITDCTQAIKLDPNDAAAYGFRGLMYSEKKDYDRAIADYTQAIKLDPNFADAYYNRGNAYSDKGDYDRGIADFNQALRIDSNNANAYNNRGVAYYNKRDYDRAIADYNQALKLDPNDANAKNNLELARRRGR
jgi:tetratricopeptide (TPR) repeat protein